MVLALGAVVLLITRGGGWMEGCKSAQYSTEQRCFVNRAQTLFAFAAARLGKNPRTTGRAHHTYDLASHITAGVGPRTLLDVCPW